MDKQNTNLANAAVMGENPDSGFIVEGKRLHAVERSVAALKNQNNTLGELISIMREALKALIIYADGKVEPHFLEIAQNTLEREGENPSELMTKLEQIYRHLPHHDRNDLNSMIHHPQKSS